MALLDASETNHERCVDFLKGVNCGIATTEAVLTEAMYLLRGARGGQDACIEFVLRGGATLIPSSQKSLKRCQELISKYADCPMDFADAGLVALGEELETNDVFTLDRRGFEVFRLFGRQSFSIYPTQ